MNNNTNNINSSNLSLNQQDQIKQNTQDPNRAAISSGDPTISSHQNDFISLTYPNEISKEIQITLRDLNLLDESLANLFANPPNSEEVVHDVLVQFRGRVARRVTRYGPLVKRIWQLCERLPINSDAQITAKTLHKKHIEFLQDYKNQLSQWWSRTERQFHTMRMASLVSEVEFYKKKEMKR